MKREIWRSSEEDNKLDSLYMAAEMIKEHLRAGSTGYGASDIMLGKLYSKLEKIRKEQE